MKSCGIIAEYNPFHNGHAYLVQEARRKSGAEVVIAVMSGNFLQRGEPAIIDKWTRTQEALCHGVDLVIELPVFYAVQSADYFAKGGIKLLQSLNVDSLCFGTDSKSPMDYQAFASFHFQHQEEIETAFQSLRNNGMNYPQQMTEVYRQLFPDWMLDFSSPNHLLGMSYAKENILYEHPMTLYAVERKQSGYHDQEIDDQPFASATAIRQAVFQKNQALLSKVVPEQTWQDLSKPSTPFVSWKMLWPFLQYQLSTSNPEQLRNIYQMTEGVEYRLLAEMDRSRNFTDFIEAVKTKRLTWTRIQRLCVYLLLQMTEVEVKQSWANDYLRVLGFNQKGQQFLKERKKVCSLPIVTNISRKNESLLRLDIRAGEVYRLAAGLLETQDYYRKPIRIAT